MFLQCMLAVVGRSGVRSTERSRFVSLSVGENPILALLRESAHTVHLLVSECEIWAELCE
jgi:hypothetical protein